MNFHSQMFFNDINHGYRAAILRENPLWLLPSYMAVATSCYYDKLRRTMRTAIVSYLLKRKLKARPTVWKAWLHVWKPQPCVCVITRPVMSQSATVINGIYCYTFLLLLCITLGAEIFPGKNFCRTRFRGINFANVGRT